MARDISFSLLSQTKEKDSTGQMKAKGEPVVKRCIGTQKSVSQNEFFKASQAGFRPEGVIEMNAADYAGETVIQMGSNKFTIYRTYFPESDFIELYYGERVGV